MRQLQIELFRRMSPEERLTQALRLYWSARELKTAAIRSQHSDWSDQQIRDAVNNAFAYART